MNSEPQANKIAFKFVVSYALPPPPTPTLMWSLVFSVASLLNLSNRNWINENCSSYYLMVLANCIKRLSTAILNGIQCGSVHWKDQDNNDIYMLNLCGKLKVKGERVLHPLKSWSFVGYTVYWFYFNTKLFQMK